MMRDWDVVVVGGANIDYLALGPTLPEPGATVRGSQFQTAPGGKGANQAVAAARLGARTALLTRVGADASGDAILACLTAEGVDTRYVRRDEGAPTGIAIIQVGDGGEKQILTRPGANLELSTADIRAASELIRGARVVLLQLEPPLETVVAVVELAHQADVRVVLDPAPARQLPNDVYQLVGIIRPNASEAEVLTGIPVTDRDSAREAGRVLLGRGVGAAIVQAGKYGDLAVWSDGEQWLPRYNVPSVDSTGAADAFAAAVATEIAADRVLSDAVSFASAAAALTTTKFGAQAGLPLREEVSALMSRSGAATTFVESESQAVDHAHAS